ncbi:MAG: hypothetical protein V8R01_03740 [Bacilli bacterium]
MAVEADGTLKIRKNGSIRNMVWDSSNSNNWARPATLNTYLNNDYYNSLSNNEQSLIQSHAYGVGAVTYYNTDLTGQIADENATIWTGNIGLMSVSDYLRANTNIVQCGNFNRIVQITQHVKQQIIYLVPITHGHFLQLQTVRALCSLWIRTASCTTTTRVSPTLFGRFSI